MLNGSVDILDSIALELTSKNLRIEVE